MNTIRNLLKNVHNKIIDHVTWAKDDKGILGIEIIFTDGTFLRIDGWDEKRVFICGGDPKNPWTL